MCSGKKVYTRNLFTIEEEEILIDLVREHSFLHNPKDKLYKNITARANCWKEIGEILKKNHDECLKKWNSIRNYYMRKRGKPAGTGSAAEFVRKRMSQLIFLEDTSVAKRKTISNVEMEMENQNDLEELNNNTEGYVTEGIASIATQGTTPDGEIENQNQYPVNTPSNGSLINAPLIDHNPTPKRRKLKDSADMTLQKNSDERMNLMRSIAARQALPQDELQLSFSSICETVKKFPPQAKLSVANTIGNMEIEFLQSQAQEQQTVLFISPVASPDVVSIPELATSCVALPQDNEVLENNSNDIIYTSL